MKHGVSGTDTILPIYTDISLWMLEESEPFRSREYCGLKKINKRNG